ncbi:hypothetical protein SAMN05443244_1847 [Terriglobus roseus]|uniref:DUF2059 domain-containing protein n=2 Tax=Terriglobus roseus TaxID=392734 RepID=A0A1H4M8E7_9BACT|nr:hypothetical protein SAMN05443244_1847 [Terriglobus roseus]
MRSMHTLAVALCLAAAPFAHADDASHRAKAEQMLQLTHTDSMMKEQLSNLQERINGMAKQQSGQGTLTPAQTTLTTTYLKQVQDLTNDEVGWEKLRPAVVQSYADTFTDADLDGIIAFYKSPAGMALLTKSPEIAGKTMTMVQDKIKDLQPKLGAMTEDYAKKMQAAAPAPAAAPAAPAAKPSTTTAKPAAPATKK